MSPLSSEQGLQLLKSGRFSDYKITCGHHEFYVHRIVIATKSEFFSLCIDSNFRESVSGVTDLPEDSPTVVASALLFMYTGRSSIESVLELWPGIERTSEGKDESTETFLRRMIGLYQVGHRLIVEGLCQYAEDEMFASCTKPAFGPIQCRGCDPDMWNNPPPCNCAETGKHRNEEVRIWASTLLLLLGLIFEELPDDPSVRARGVTAGVDAWKELKGLMWIKCQCEQNRCHCGDLEMNIRKQISDFLEEHDLVAWKVAQKFHYRMEDLKRQPVNRLAPWEIAG